MRRQNDEPQENQDSSPETMHNWGNRPRKLSPAPTSLPKCPFTGMAEQALEHRHTQPGVGPDVGGLTTTTSPVNVGASAAGLALSLANLVSTDSGTSLLADS